MNMSKHHIRIEDSWWVAAEMIAAVTCSTASAVMRDALVEYARRYGLTVVDGEVTLIGHGVVAPESTEEIPRLKFQWG